MSAPLEKLLKEARLDLILTRIEKDPNIIEEIINNLNSNIRTIRFNSIVILGKLGEQSASSLPKLSACLEDSDWSIRREAVRSLGNIGNIAETVISGLCNLINDNEISIRKEVAITLGKIGKCSDESIATLIKALEDSDEDVRIAAANSLGSLESDSPDTISSLLNSLGDVSWKVRANAVSSLGKIRSNADEVISDLLLSLEDDDWRVRNRAITSLVNFGEKAIQPVINALNNKNRIVQKAAIEILGELKSNNPEILKNLAPLLLSKREAIRGKTIDTLRNIGKNSLPNFLSAIDHSNNNRRILLISGIGGIEENITEYIPKLVQILKSNDILKSRYNVIKPGKNLTFKEKLIYHLRRIKIILLSFLNDPTSNKAKIRVEISRALGKIGKDSELAIEILIDGLSDNRNQVRRASALALGDIGSNASKAIPNILESLEDPKPDVRWRASEALGKIGVDTPEVITGLEELLYDQYDHVCVSAEFALDKLKTTN